MIGCFKLKMYQMANGDDLAPRQSGVLNYIREYQGEFGISPSVREICKRFKLKSPGGIHRILHVLIDNGYLLSTPGKKTAWRFPDGAIKPSIPLVGKIAAGTPIAAIEHHDDELPFDPSFFGSGSCFALRIQGDSMIQAHIVDGDIAIIRQQSKANNKQIVAAMVEGLLPEATLKIFYRKKGQIELVAANESFPPLAFKGKEQKIVQILGVLVGVIRKN